MGAIVVTWMPPCVGGTKATLGATQVTCVCQWCRVGATVSGCHQGHMWVMLGSHMGATVVTWVPP